jgi:hypothetical protein
LANANLTSPFAAGIHARDGKTNLIATWIMRRSSVTDVFTPVRVSIASTEAPAMTAPDGSVTTREILPAMLADATAKAKSTTAPATSTGTDGYPY